MAIDVDHFIVVGAGASFGARDADPRPPLGDQLADCLARWYAANAPNGPRSVRMDDVTAVEVPSWDIYWPARVREALEQFLRDANGRGFEKAALDFFNQHHNQLTFMGDHLNRVVGFALLTGDLCAFPEVATGDRYDRLLSRLKGKLAFVSLNYDILLEEALIRAGLEWDYSGPSLSGVRKPVVGPKPHGSVNWLRHISVAVGSNLPAVKAASRTMPQTTVSGPHHSVDSQCEYVPAHRTVADAHRGNVVAEMKHDHGHVPVIAVYAEGKPAENNYSCIAFCQNDCLATIQANPEAAVTVIGARLPTLQDDERFRTIAERFGALRGPRLYVGSDTTWESLRFQKAATTFADFVP
jgi:hypothetical protein